MRKSSLIVAAIVLMSTLFLGLTLLPDVRATTLYVGGAGPGNHTTIQAAINDSNPGDVVYVYSGTFHEQVLIDKAITLVGEDRDTTIIDGYEAGNVVHISAHWVNVSGLTIRNGSYDAGVYLDSVHDCSIVDNNISDNKRNGIQLDFSSNNVIESNTILRNDGRGIDLGFSSTNLISTNTISLSLNYAIDLYNSRSNTIIGNTMVENGGGVRLGYSDWNTVLGNSLSPSMLPAVLVRSSSSNTLSQNSMTGGGITLDGNALEFWNTHIIDSTNTVSSRPVYYWKNATGGSVPSNVGQVILANCTGVAVEEQVISDVFRGIQIGFSSGSVVRNNTVWNTTTGMRLDHSRFSEVSGNEVNLSEYGIYLWHSDDNTVRNNTVVSADEVGIIALSSENNTLTGNDAVGCGYAGIRVSSSYNNTVAGNNVSSTEWTGILISYSDGTIVTSNRVNLGRTGVFIFSSKYNSLESNILAMTGISLGGSNVEHWNTHAIDTTNTVNSKPVQYLKNITGGSAPDGAGEVIIANCSGIIVANQTIENSTYGILIGFTSNSTVYGNTLVRNRNGINLYKSENNSISSNDLSSQSNHGIRLHMSDWNNVANNTASWNGQNGVIVDTCANNSIVENRLISNGIYGIYLRYADDTRVYHNNLIANAVNAQDNRATNHWDDGYPSGGNYWSDYNGTDNKSGPNQDQPGSDGKGDTPYDIDGDSRDRYPRMYPTYIFPPRPPTVLEAYLTGSGFENVTVRWSLSPDDGAGMDTVHIYGILRGSTYDAKGVGYQILGYTPKGTDFYVDNYSGEGDPNSYFYSVFTVDLAGNGASSAIQAAKFTRPLASGPNLISIPLLQSDESIETGLQTVKYDKAWFYDGEWNWYVKSKTYRRGLWSVNHTIGLWVNVTQDSNVTVAGIVPAQTTIHLHGGWNLVSFPSVNTSFTVADLKASLSVERVEGFDLAPPHFLRVLSDSDVLLAGRAFWVKVEADVVWNVAFE